MHLIEQERRQGSEEVTRLDNIPGDADGDAIRRVVADGADLGRPMDIDIAVAVPNRSVGLAVEKRLIGSRFRTALEFDKIRSAWTCYCSVSMILGYKEILAVQEELDVLCRPLGGIVDGWGTFGNN